jgi:hypothetical protein
MQIFVVKSAPTLRSLPVRPGNVLARPAAIPPEKTSVWRRFFTGAILTSLLASVGICLLLGTLLSEAQKHAQNKGQIIAELRGAADIAEKERAGQTARAANLQRQFNEAIGEIGQAKAALDAATKEISDLRQNAKERPAEPLEIAEKKAGDDKATIQSLSGRLKKLEQRAKAAEDANEALRKRLQIVGSNAPAYKQVDEISLAAPTEAEKSLRGLAAYFAAAAVDDKEKVRAAYRWLTDRIAYDADGFFADSPGDQSAETVFRTKKCVCEGYANLMVALCTLMGLESVKVRGYAKGLGYLPGPPSTKANHAWNAVKINDRWYLVDATWGAGYINDKRFVRQFTDFYFLATPDKLIWSHFPTDSKWQLLTPPVTRQQFEGRPKVDLGLWQLGVTVEQIVAQQNEMPSKGLVRAPRSQAKATTMQTAPLELDLTAGKQYTFTFESSDFVTMLAWQDEKTMMPFAKSGNEFRLSFQPRQGKLFIGGSFANTKNIGFAILEYVVD